MDINNLYVIVYDYKIGSEYGGGNETADELVTKTVYTSKEDAEKAISNPKIMRVIDLEDWGSEKYSSGYICAYG